MNISNEEFKKISALIYDRFGITLTDSKRNLVCGRLQKVITLRGYKTFKEYLDYVETAKSPEALSELINKISTNHTFFFREKAHFDFLSKTVFPELENRQEHHDLRIWCAGCSSGEEAYSLVIQMMEYWGSKYAGLNAGVLATDISEKVLDIAASAVYPEEKLKEIPLSTRHKYFRKKTDKSWEVSQNVKEQVTLRRFNLMNEHFPFKKPFHIIFCRNVMIYFDTMIRKALVNRFYDFTENNGYFFIGHSETLGRNDSPFEYITPAVYRKKDAKRGML